MAAATGTDMDEAFYKLFLWLAPSYPIGAYTFSHGLEWSVAAGEVGDAVALRLWLEDVLEHGAGRSDAMLLAAAWRAETAGDARALEEVATLALALAPTAERLIETTATGRAFAEMTSSAWGDACAVAPLPVAVGQAAARHKVPINVTAFLYLQSFANNLVSAAIRLVPLGQTDGQRVMAALMPQCRHVASDAVAVPMDAIGGFAIRAEIASMRHETQDVRLFRS